MTLPAEASGKPRWHMLQISDVLDEEMGAALARSVTVFGWKPERTMFPWRHALRTREIARDESLPFHTQSLTLMRGYARAPWTRLLQTGRSVSRLMQSVGARPNDVLLCTVPFFAAVAEQWPGPVVYWLTDLIAAYESAKGMDVASLDARMCRAATLVCPNSSRLGDYLRERCACPGGKIVTVPNATRESNLLPAPSHRPGPLPLDAGRVGRPVVGVIGNLAGNLDWLLLAEAMRRTPEFTWLFVGPATMQIPDPVQSEARRAALAMPNANFIGPRPYGSLYEYARAFDVAVLPYRRCEPTFSGSSTRFYEHLAACRPMLATHGFEELLHKEPLLRLVDDADGLVSELRALRDLGFDDGLGEIRWRASQEGTWQVRAGTIQRELRLRLQGEDLSPAGLDTDDRDRPAKVA